MTEHQAIEYEIASSSLFKSLVYCIFPRLAIWRGKRKWKRYSQFMYEIELEEQKNKATRREQMHQIYNSVK